MNAVAPEPVFAPALQETAQLDLKCSFDPAVNGEWCELLKDIVAMANSGGGRIIIGLKDDGTPSGISADKVHGIDPAVFVDKVFSYTGVHFAGVRTAIETHAGTQVAVLSVDEATSPLIFSKPGTYQIAEAKQKNAFSSGTLYVRHGAKSEPGTSDDMRSILERHLKNARAALLANLRQVVEAPAGAVVSIAPVIVVPTDMSARPVRFVQDPTVAAAAILDPNLTHPHRQKEVVARVNEILAGRAHVSSNDIVAIRRLHKIEEDRSLCYLPKFGSCLYSDLFIKWVVTHVTEDGNFLGDLRQRFHDLTVSRNAAMRRARWPGKVASNSPNIFS